jgi:hypothetical protein
MSARYDPRPRVLVHGAVKPPDTARAIAQARPEGRTERRAARHGRPGREVLDQVELLLRRTASAISDEERPHRTQRVPKRR